MRLKLWISWICALTVMLTMFAACGKDNENGTNDSSTTPSGQTTDNSGDNSSGGDDTPTQPGFDYESGDRLDPTLDYGNENFQIFTWDTQQVTEWIKEIDAESSEVEKTLYAHLENAKDRLNLNITIHQEPGRYAQRNQFIDTLYNLDSTGMAPDLVCQYSLCASIGMIRGLYGNLLETDYLDFNAPWWNESLVDGNIINGSLYYITGDLTPTIIYNMYGVIFNKTLLNDRGIEAPYELVRTGNWTLDTMLELIRGTAINPNTDGVYDATENVLYGLMVQKSSIDAFQTGFGITAVEKNENGQWQLSQDFRGTMATNIVEDLRSLVKDYDDVFYDRGEQYGTAVFKNEDAIFDVDTMGSVDRLMTAKPDMKIGVVPVPKYDAIQQNYGTRLAQMISMFSITSNCPNPDCSSAVLEAMGSDGYRRVTPKVFEETFGLQYADAPDDAEMYILIRDSIVYDPGNLQSTLATFSAFRNCVWKDYSWEKYYEDNLSVYAAALVDINNVGVKPPEGTES